MTKKDITSKIKNIPGLQNAVIEFVEKTIYRYMVKIHTGGCYLYGEVLQQLKKQLDGINIGTPDIFTSNKNEISIIFTIKDYS